ncbi:MAG: proton-conducting transporter membrane subunit [Bdellovibrionota bacterium]
MIQSLFLASLFAPFSLMVLLGLSFLMRIPMYERWLSFTVKYFSLAMAGMGFTLWGLVWFHSPSEVLLHYGSWIKVGEYSFDLPFIVDLLGATYSLLTSCLIGIIFRFSRNYLHREEGYFRFTFLLTVLWFGLNIVSFARSLDLLFVGWELVGTTSVLLISYFYTQVQPVRHALKAIVSYRLCDMGILAAAAWSHHYLHSTDFVALPKLLHHDHGGSALIFIGIFVIFASLAKAGQLPMSSWLPTAMEGPTPSSAIFYGALSVHLGPFLLIRFHDYIDNFPSLLIAIGVIGGTSAIWATLVGRTRSDAKTMLGFATITQVGIMWIEIALGYTNFAMFHMVAHASLRTWQFLRSMSLIHDFFENPTVKQDVSIRRDLSFLKLLPEGARKKIYVHALHSFHLDFFTSRVIRGVSFPMKVIFAVEKKMMVWDNKVLARLLRKN